jgi:UDP-glucose 4-epimerase
VKILITGISGAHARLVTELLLRKGHEVFGIDRRPWPRAPEGVRVFQTDVRKRPATDVFRTHRPDVVVHMATVTHFHRSREERFRINLNGTKAVFDHCHEYGVKQALFIGRHTIYGAAPDAPLFRTEDEPPLAVSTFPELADLVAADMYASTALWKWPDLTTCVLRMVYALGPLGRGTLANFLHGPRVPMAFGFDPLFQFMHDRDAARAIVTAIEARINGVYNVSGPQPVPLSVLCRGTDRTPVPLPDALLLRAMGRFGISRLPKGAIPHLKHPVVVDGSRFEKATGFEARHDEHAVMASFREIKREDERRAEAARQAGQDRR